MYELVKNAAACAEFPLLRGSFAKPAPLHEQSYHSAYCIYLWTMWRGRRIPGRKAFLGKLHVVHDGPECPNIEMEETPARPDAILLNHRQQRAWYEEENMLKILR